MNEQPQNSPNSYAIICDPAVGRTPGIHVLALADKTKPLPKKVFWIGNDPDLIFRCFDKAVAEKICSRFKFNNPRVVDYWEARGFIEAQAGGV